MKGKAKFLGKVNKNKKESVTQEMINGVVYQWRRECDFRRYKKIYTGSKTSKRGSKTSS